MAGFSPAARADECANVLIVLDRSSSMDRLLVGDERSRWEVAIEAIGNLLDGYSNNVKFGLALFPGGTATSCEVACTAGFVAVDIASGSASTIEDTLSTAARCQGTPIGVTMEELVDMPDLGEAGKRNYVLLVTDGSETCPGDAAAVAAELFAQEPEVRTFVIGFAEDINADELDAIASAGHTIGAFTASDEGTLEAAFDQILGAVYEDPEFGCIGGGIGDGGLPGFDSGVPDVDGGGDAGAVVKTEDGGGCGCRSAGRSRGALGLSVLAVALGVLLRRRWIP
ncbi:MAG: VWA domain-containing protein [Deltaproteobacteria bacterium]|nr:VWA domain-containing protein [Deltaproteobacteria bacterium]